MSGGAFSGPARLAACALAVFLIVPTLAMADLSRPGDGDGPTTVSVRIFVLNVDKIATADQNFTANVFFEAEWKDPRLAHDSEAAVISPMMDIWNPRFQIVNRQSIAKSFPEVAEISPDGTVLYRQRVWGSFSQPLHLQEFPFDSHTFAVRIAAVGFTPDEIKIVESPEISGVSDDLSLADFRIGDTCMEVSPYQIAPDAPLIAAAALQFEAVRESRYYVVKVLIPLVLIVAMSWITFFFDPKEAAAGIRLGATVMLTLIAYRFAIDSSLPKVAYLTRMDMFMLGATILIFSSLMELVIAAHMAKIGRLEGARWLHRAMRIVFPVTLIVVALKSFVF